MPLTGRYEPLKVEEEVSEWWSRNRIPEKVFNVNKGAPVFAFLEGPPTANGYMHVGHARGRVYKDIVLRLKTMQGFDVWRRGGWDCLGLPTELEVEKKLGFRSKKDVERFGLERFVEEADKLVDHYIDHWRRVSERLAVWLDYDNAYETRKERYIEHVWWLVKKAHEKGDLAENFRVVPNCPRCETPLSSHEVAQGYKEVEDPSIYVKFPIEGSQNLYIVIWTTTPWTLAGNEAVAVHPDETYVKVRVDGEEWILAEKLLERVMEEVGKKDYQVIDRVPGTALEGLQYRHPLLEKVPEHREHKPPAHTVITADFVTMEEGTGCVHTAPAHGPEDFEVGQRLGLPVFNPVAQNGYFTERGGEYRGLWFSEAGERIMDYLEERGLLIKRSVVLHTYPHCWRCDSPLIYLSSRQWFLKIDRIKPIMIEENRKVFWRPPWAGEHRFGDWLENAEDWCISRTKFWGTPLPVWRCEKCGEIRVVGSKDELMEAEERPEKIRLLRPWVDRVFFRCGKCGGRMRREPFVMDTWLDSGMAHTASIDGLRNQDLFKKLFPYDFITEAIDQTRGWFYTLLFTSALAYGKAPYKSVLNQGHVMDAEGKKMSKSRGNVIWAKDSVETYGADPLRLYLVSKSAPWDNMNFVPQEVEQITQELNILWNVFTFATTYFELDRYDPERVGVEAVEKHLKPEDRWILSRINTLTREVERSLEVFNIHSAARALRGFVVEDLSRLYVRAVRRRVWVEEQTWDKLAVYATLHYVLKKLTLLLAPFTPYLAEKLYQHLRLEEDPESVHMARWPRVDEKYVDEELEDMMDIVRQTMSEALALRQRRGWKLRKPVMKTVIVPRSSKVQKALTNLQDFLKTQLNTLELEVLEPESRPEWTRYVVSPVYSRIGPRFGKKTPEVIERLVSMDGERVRRELESSGVIKLMLRDGATVELTAEDLTVEEKTPENIDKEEGKFADIYIDFSETHEIMASALAKELIRRIQVMRKEMNLNVSDYVEVYIQTQNHEKAKIIEEKKDYIMEETRARSLSINKDVLEGYVKEWRIEGEEIRIAVKKA